MYFLSTKLLRVSNTDVVEAQLPSTIGYSMYILCADNALLDFEMTSLQFIKYIITDNLVLHRHYPN